MYYFFLFYIPLLNSLFGAEDEPIKFNSGNNYFAFVFAQIYTYTIVFITLLAVNITKVKSFQNNFKCILKTVLKTKPFLPFIFTTSYIFEEKM